MTDIPKLPVRPSAPTIAYTKVVTVNVSGTTTIAAGTMIYARNMDDISQRTGPYFRVEWGSPAVYASIEYDYRGQLANEGTVWVWSDQFTASALLADRLTNKGNIFAETVTIEKGEGYTYYSSAYAVVLFGDTLINSGRIQAVATGGNAFGVSGDVMPTVRNSGLISAQSTAGVDVQQSGGAYAMILSNGGKIVNEASGRILAEGREATAIWLGRGAHPTETGVQVINHGLIEARSTDGALESVGLRLENLQTELMTVENYGTIRGDRAIWAPSSSFVTSLQNSLQTVTNHAGGLIDGAVMLERGDDVLNNAGTINGHVDLGEGNDLYDGRGGLLNGVANGGGGDDRMTGGDKVDALMGDAGNDILIGMGGNDLLLGAGGADRLEGGAGNDGLYGEAGRDVIITAGGDFASGGIGNDRLETGDYSFARIDGGSGVDTWSLAAGARAIDLSAVLATSRVVGIEQIALNGDKLLVLRAGNLSLLTGSVAAVTVDGQASDALYLVGDWVQQATQVVADGISYWRYTAGSASLLVATDVKVTIGDTPPAAGGLDSVAAGPAAPQPDDIPGATLTSADINVSGLIVTQSLTIDEGEIWRSTGPQAVMSGSGGNVVIRNYGAVIGENPLGNAIAFGPVGTGDVSFQRFYNHGLVQASAGGDGIARAFFTGSGGQLVNYGRVYAFAVDGEAWAVTSFESEDGLINYGDVFAYSQNDAALGVFLYNYGTIRNEGIIEADGASFAVGVDMSNGGGGVTNSGTIIATAAFGYSIGIAQYSRGEVLNSGTIKADIAWYGTAHGDPFSITNSGEIDGAIYLTTDEAQYSSLRIDNRGTINGSIEVDAAVMPVARATILDGVSVMLNDVVLNSGVIHGDIWLGRGDDLYDGRGGRLDGRVFGGEGADRLYGGKGDDDLNGEGGNDLMDGGVGADRMTGGLGNDSYVVDNAGDIVIERAGEGVDTVITSIGDTLGDNVEALKLMNLTAGVTARGNALDNMISAAGVTGALAAGTTIRLYGEDGNDNITGSKFGDRLDGGAGNDVLDGGAGADSMYGGLGSDTYYVDNVGDVVVEKAGEGYDVVITNVDYRLGTDVEGIKLLNLTRGVEVHGNALNNSFNAAYVSAPLTAGTQIRMFGEGGNDTLLGSRHDDYLDGGTGVDTMTGGLGNDTYVVDDARDVVVEQAGQGYDVVVTNIDYTLGANVEGIKLLNLTQGVEVHGNALNNSFNAVYVSAPLAAGTQIRMFGEGGNDTLLGSRHDDYVDGGTGVDTMTGGFGNDTYVVDNKGDVVVEQAGQGYDVVITSIDYTLGANVEGIKLLNLTRGVEAHGNGLNNSLNAAYANGPLVVGTQIKLFGEGGNDTLLGSRNDDYLDGGTGADSMTGGFGNDTYVVDNAGDVVVEKAGEGYDVVITNIDYTLGANVEGLKLLNLTKGVEAHGNGMNNSLNAAYVNTPLAAGTQIRLFGEGGNDSLLGSRYGDFLDGGAGNDTLQGGGGNDRFHFGDALNALSNVDTILDFQRGDVIELDDAVFKGLSTGALGAGAFVANAAGAATTADQRIVYDTDSGQLFFDADGSGAGGAVLFAVLNGHPAIGAADFVVV